jgi:hypothetical protein
MLPSVTKAKYVKDYLIEIKFNDGAKKVIDFEPWLTGPIFRPLKSKHYFKTLYAAVEAKTPSDSRLKHAG